MTGLSLTERRSFQYILNDIIFFNRNTEQVVQPSLHWSSIRAQIQKLNTDSNVLLFCNYWLALLSHGATTLFVAETWPLSFSFIFLTSPSASSELYQFK